MLQKREKKKRKRTSACSVKERDYVCKKRGRRGEGEKTEKGGEIREQDVERETREDRDRK